jgi:hypothetical protein
LLVKFLAVSAMTQGQGQTLMPLFGISSRKKQEILRRYKWDKESAGKKR